MRVQRRLSPAEAEPRGGKSGVSEAGRVLALPLPSCAALNFVCLICKLGKITVPLLQGCWEIK